MLIKQKIKKIYNNLKSPTPWKWRKIGYALSGASVFVTGTAIISDYHKLGLIFLIIGAIGKFITDFFAEN